MNTENMNILAFDTTLNKTYIALQKGETVDARVIESDEKNYHSAYLISAIKNIMQKNDLKLQELGLIAVNNGPGSFTGIRVGVTVAKTLSKELGVNVLGVSSLDILQKAYEISSNAGNIPLNPAVILDARKETFYFKAPNGCENSVNAANDDILLVLYSDIQTRITEGTVICDTSSVSKLKTAFEISDEHPENTRAINLINFEEDNINLALPLLAIAKQAVQASSSQDLSWDTELVSGSQTPNPAPKR